MKNKVDRLIDQLQPEMIRCISCKKKYHIKYNPFPYLQFICRKCSIKESKIFLSIKPIEYIENKIYNMKNKVDKLINQLQPEMVPCIVCHEWKHISKMILPDDEICIICALADPFIIEFKDKIYWRSIFFNIKIEQPYSKKLQNIINQQRLISQLNNKSFP